MPPILKVKSALLGVFTALKLFPQNSVARSQRENLRWTNNCLVSCKISHRSDSHLQRFWRACISTNEGGTLALTLGEERRPDEAKANLCTVISIAFGHISLRVHQKSYLPFQGQVREGLVTVLAEQLGNSVLCCGTWANIPFHKIYGYHWTNRSLRITS